MGFIRNKVPVSKRTGVSESSFMAAIWLLSLKRGSMSSERTAYVEHCFGKPPANGEVQGREAVPPQREPRCGGKAAWEVLRLRS